MRILFTYIGGLGHLYPLVPLARAASAAGHTVAVAGSGRLTDHVRAAGFEALATSPPRPPDEPAPVRDHAPLEVADARAAEVEFAENFADKGARRHATAVTEHLRAWRPDVVVRDEADLGSAIAAQARGVPVAVVQVLAAGTLIRPELVAPFLEAVRAEHGLDPDPGLAMLGSDLVLSPFPPSFRSPDAPIRLSPVGYRVASQARRSRAASDRPGVYATLGTVFGLESGDLFERLLAGLAAVDADVLLTVGRHLDPAEFGPRPDHVRIERFVPQDEALASTDLVVSHGGSGALLGALERGLPSVILPLGADQPHNAERAAELDLAVVLDAATATAEQIGAAVTSALADEALAQRVRRVADEIEALPDVAAVVPLLADLAGGVRGRRT